MCNGCKTGNNNMLFYLLVLLILTAVLCKVLGTTPEISALIGLILAGVYWVYGKNSMEHLETIQPITDNMIQSDGIPNYNSDDTSFSEYDNISFQRDIDSMGQRNIDLELSPVDTTEFDNTDIVESAIAKHSSNFQPDRAHGFSSSNSAYLSNMTLGEPDPNGNNLRYTVPLNDFAYDLDESLSRGQQYRASINKRAIDGAVRSTKNIFQRFFNNEMDENEKRVWYSAEAQDLETDFRSYY
jgi:hypothetical protein